MNYGGQQPQQWGSPQQGGYAQPPVAQPQYQYHQQQQQPQPQQQYQYQQQPQQQQPQQGNSSMPGKGLEFDAFASQGFKKEAVAQKAQPVANQERRSSYDYVPLSQIPSSQKPAAEKPTALAAPMQPGYGGPMMQGGGMYSMGSQQPQQGALVPFGMAPQPPSQQAMVPYGMPQQPAAMVPYGMQAPHHQPQMHSMGGFPAQGYYPAQQQQQQPPPQQHNPFVSAPAAPTSFAPGAPPAQWDPFAGGPVGAPQQQSQPAANGQWDPFTQQQQQQQQQQGQAALAAASNGNEQWGDLTNDDIWGDLPSKPSGADAEDDGEWSDDDVGIASDDGERRQQQEESDFELALRLQREEEARSAGTSGAAAGNVRGNWGAGTAAPHQNSTGDKPQGEVLARISKRTLLVKVWKPTYFIFELPDLLLLYRSRDDYIYNPKGTMIKKSIEIKHNHTLTALKRKVYKDYGYLWHFTVEEQMDYGPSIVAKFASHDRRPLEELGNRMADAIREKRRVRSRMNHIGRQLPPPRTNFSTTQDPNNYGRRSAYEDRGSYNAGSTASAGGASDDKYSRWGNIA